MIKFLVLSILLVELCFGATFFDLARKEWDEFKTIHNKHYADAAEESLRYKIYLENRYKIAEHNTRYYAKKVSYKLGINRFSDMLKSEIAGIFNGYNQSLSKNQDFFNYEEQITFIDPANVELPTEVDWRTKGAVTGVKDQGYCGSCYAFSATGSLEGQHFRKTGILVSLSEQNIVDCSAAYDNLGCNGGFMTACYKYVKDNGGIDTEDSYPYKEEKGTCHFSKATVGATDKGFVKLPNGDEEALKKAVATIGPISVAIDAGHDTFFNYKSGIYYNDECSTTMLDHGVLVVGYGNDGTDDYWIVKNSWGTTWGENGYIKMSRNKNNQCGIASDASYPLV